MDLSVKQHLLHGIASAISFQPGAVLQPRYHRPPAGTERDAVAHAAGRAIHAQVAPIRSGTGYHIRLALGRVHALQATG
jgi:hypothetical protein